MPPSPRRIASRHVRPRPRGEDRPARESPGAAGVPTTTAFPPMAVDACSSDGYQIESVRGLLFPASERCATSADVSAGRVRRSGPKPAKGRFHIMAAIPSCGMRAEAGPVDNGSAAEHKFPAATDQGRPRGDAARCAPPSRPQTSSGSLRTAPVAAEVAKRP